MKRLAISFGAAALLVLTLGNLGGCTSTNDQRVAARERNVEQPYGLLGGQYQYDQSYPDYLASRMGVYPHGWQPPPPTPR